MPYELHAATLTSSLTEQRKQQQAQADFDEWSKQGLEVGEYPWSQPTPTYDRSLRNLLARRTIKFQGSDDSIKTAYRDGEKVPDSAYRDHPASPSDSKVDQKKKPAVAFPTAKLVGKDNDDDIPIPSPIPRPLRQSRKS